MSDRSAATKSTRYSDVLAYLLCACRHHVDRHGAHGCDHDDCPCHVARALAVIRAVQELTPVQLRLFREFVAAYSTAHEALGSG